MSTGHSPIEVTMKASKSTKSSGRNKPKQPRERRYFSEDFRKARVKEYDEGKTQVGDICHTYGVSRSAVYKWIHKYSTHYEKSIVKVVEEKSETKKRQALEAQVTELKKLIGEQTIALSYYKKLVELANEHYQIDIEKNLRGQF